MNYWFDEEHVGIVAHLLDEGGVFVFDTFNTKPESTPQFKEYEIHGIYYGEAWQLVGNVVHHWQMCEGMVPHYTSFRWIDPEEFDVTLKKFFPKVSRGQQGKTDIYTCYKD